MQRTRNHHLLKLQKISQPHISYLVSMAIFFVLCTASTSLTTAFTLQIIPPSRTLICKGDSLHLLASISQSGVPISWSPNDGSITPLSDTSVIIQPSQDTWYYAIANDGLCTATDSVFIEVQEVILMTNEVEGRCAGDPFMLAAQANVDGIFTWFPGELIGDTVFVNTQDTTIYTVEFEAACGILTNEVIVRAAENPAIQIFCINLEVNPILIEGQDLNIFVLPNNTEGAVFEWDDGASEPNRTVQPLAPETFYSVTVTYPNGCTRTAEKGVTAERPPVETDKEAVMPNAFTPDGDNENDYFGPVLFGDATVTSFQIFNRWGELVYDNDTPTTGWDGTQNGQPAASDVYLYKAVVTPLSGEEEVFIGNVTLIR